LWPLPGDGTGHTLRDMRIGVDISQIVFEGTGVSRYVRRMVRELLKLDKQNNYILFGASLRQRHKFSQFFHTLQGLNKRIKLVVVPIPPTLLDILWNKLHILPIECFIGSVDVFWSSDWTQPPLAGALGVTTIHDLSIFRYPESFAETIVAVQKRRLRQTLKECKFFFCDSEATKKDAGRLLGIPDRQLKVIYPGSI